MKEMKGQYLSGSNEAQVATCVANITDKRLR